MSQVRRAGSTRLADGRTVTWSVAEGRRGRRWRTATSDSLGILELVLLLELRPDGVLSKVELAGSNGLLSLHPEGDVLHGNVVGADGVRHLRFAWSAEHVLVIEGSTVSLAAAGIRAATGGAGERSEVPAIRVRSDLTVEETTAVFERVARTSIGVEIDSLRLVVEVDELGIPVALRSGGDWPLELD